jgi:hypothetical protein
MRRASRAVLAVVLVALAGCASATPATPVTTIDPLVGKWKGTVTVGRAVDFIYLTIYPDRTLTAIWGSITARGTVTVSGGQASYQMAPPIQEGSIRLYSGQGKRQLVLESMSGAFYATVEPDS